MPRRAPGRPAYTAAQLGGLLFGEVLRQAAAGQAAAAVSERMVSAAAEAAASEAKAVADAADASSSGAAADSIPGVAPSGCRDVHGLVAGLAHALPPVLRLYPPHSADGGGGSGGGSGGGGGTGSGEGGGGGVSGDGAAFGAAFGAAWSAAIAALPPLPPLAIAAAGDPGRWGCDRRSLPEQQQHHHHHHHHHQQQQQQRQQARMSSCGSALAAAALSHEPPSLVQIRLPPPRLAVVLVGAGRLLEPDVASAALWVSRWQLKEGGKREKEGRCML